ncbi:MAG: class I SAM-dependent methyltransferase [Planctomycetota bacterium]
MTFRLDARLRLVAQRIEMQSIGTTHRHADIGCDHGHLIANLLSRQIIDYGIAIDNKVAPYRNACRTLQRFVEIRTAEVQLANGMSDLRPGDVDSVSICGLGGSTIVAIADAMPETLPDRLILQPNKDRPLVRAWARTSGFHLIDESHSGGQRPFNVMTLERHDRADPAYQDLPLDLAIEFGPSYLRQDSKRLMASLREERCYWLARPRRHPLSQQRFDRIEACLRYLGHSFGTPA